MQLQPGYSSQTQEEHWVEIKKLGLITWSNIFRPIMVHLRQQHILALMFTCNDSVFLFLFMIFIFVPPTYFWPLFCEMTVRDGASCS